MVNGRHQSVPGRPILFVKDCVYSQSVPGRHTLFVKDCVYSFHFQFTSNSLSIFIQIFKIGYDISLYNTLMNVPVHKQLSELSSFRSWLLVITTSRVDEWIVLLRQEHRSPHPDGNITFLCSRNTKIGAKIIVCHKILKVNITNYLVSS